MFAATTPVNLGPAEPGLNLPVVLGGDMAKYQWTINGEPYSRTNPLHVRLGQRPTITFDNTTMMYHPIHLHGHTFQMIKPDGSPGARKDTIIVLPKQKSSSRPYRRQPRIVACCTATTLITKQPGCRPASTTSSEPETVSKKSSSNSLTTDDCSICGQWPAPSTTIDRAPPICLGNLGGPTGRKEFVASPFDDERGHPDALVGPRVEGVADGAASGRRNRAAATASHAPGAMLDS